MKTKSICLSLLLILITVMTVNNGIVTEAKPIELKLEETIEQKIYNTCLDNGLDTLMAKIIVAQARHESGNFKSKLFKEHRNAFGLLHSRRRKTTSRGPLGRAEGRNGYASYNTVQESTQDALFMLMNRGDIKFNSIDDYSIWLKSIHYYEADEKLYRNALKKHLKNVRKIIK